MGYSCLTLSNLGILNSLQSKGGCFKSDIQSKIFQEYIGVKQKTYSIMNDSTPMLPVVVGVLDLEHPILWKRTYPSKWQLGLINTRKILILKK